MAHMYTTGISESHVEIVKDDPKCRGGWLPNSSIGIECAC